MVNDVSIITGLIAVFLIVGTFLPILQDGFGTPIDNNPISFVASNLLNATGQMGEKTTAVDVASIGSLGFFDFVLSIIGMFTWTFGALPFWLDLIFLIGRITLLLLLIRLIRSGGG